jgi:hypothetical protein
MKEAKAIETEPDAWERFEKAIHTIAPPKKAKAAVTIQTAGGPLELKPGDRIETEYEGGRGMTIAVARRLIRSGGEIVELPLSPPSQGRDTRL